MSNEKPNLKTVKKQVEYLLSQYVECRNSYATLDMMYMREFLNMPWLDSEVYGKLMYALKRMQSVERCARKIWEEGKYLPTDRTILMRRGREKQMRQEVMNL